MSLTKNSGNPDLPSEELDKFPSDQQDDRPFPLTWILLAIVVLVFSCVVGYQILTVLYVIVLPPAPPIPDGAMEIRHTSTSHGIDEWSYRLTQPVCDLLTFYIAQGGQCPVNPNCSIPTSSELPPGWDSSNQPIAYCVADEQASMFSVRWQLFVDRVRNTGTDFRLMREVFWTGAPPPLQ